MTQGGIELTAEERSRGMGVIANELLAATKAAVTAHWSFQAPNYQPKEVEVSTRIELPSFSRDLLCITDMRDTSDRVVDLKTSQKKKPADSADVSTQLTLYAIAFQHDHGKLPASLRLDVIVLSGAAPTRQVLKTKREPEDLPPLVARINAVVDSIERGSFPPTSPTNWWCSAKFCGYFETCRYVRHSPQTYHEDSHGSVVH
jgi:CRISPR/Cas system-associated exonuclease Cas4 (RecB family)